MVTLLLAIHMTNVNVALHFAQPGSRWCQGQARMRRSTNVVFSLHTSFNIRIWRTYVANPCVPNPLAASRPVFSLYTVRTFCIWEDFLHLAAEEVRYPYVIYIRISHFVFGVNLGLIVVSKTPTYSRRRKMFSPSRGSPSSTWYLNP